MTQLTPHFTLAEFTRSQTASTRGINNQPGPGHRANLVLTAFGLEQVRSIIGDKSIRVTSGYRSPALNKAVGGVPTSDHAKGYAADISVRGMPPLAVAKAIVKSSLVFDQVILEVSRNIVHISFNPRLRGQVLTQKKGAGTPFTKGLPYR